MNGKIQQWLTPALLGAGVALLVYIATEQRALGDKVESALQQLTKHRTVLIREHPLFFQGMPREARGAELP